MSEPFLSLPIADGIPEKRARFLFRVRSEKARAEDEQLAATQSHGVLSQKRYMEITGNKVVAALAGIDNFNHVEQDDFVISLRTFEGGIERASEPGCISPAYTVLAPSKEVEPKFFHYLLKSKVFISHLQTTVTGIRDGKSVKFENFANIVLPTPALATQRQIGDFLDRETARIDLLIEKKQRLVALLGENAKTRKLHLVTGQQKGSQKATKILWAPSIPDHWEERAVWMLFELGRGRVMSHEYIAENEGEYPIYSSQTANDGVMGYINTYDFEGNYLTWTTDGAKAGTVFRRKGRFNCTNVCGTLRPLTKGIDLNYAQVALDTATDFFVRHDINPKLMNGVMSKIRVPYPPLNEQSQIGVEIERIAQSLKPLLDKTQSSIDRLKDFRSALITAAVTGQIDVTTYAKSGTPDRRLDAIQEEMGA